MKTRYLTFAAGFLALTLSGCAMIGSLLSDGGSADVSLAYTKYPEVNFSHIKNVAVLPFEEGSIGSTSYSLWDILEKHFSTNSLSIAIADDLAGKISEKGIFKLYDRSIAKNDSSIQMVIAGTILAQDVNHSVSDNSYTDKEGKYHSVYNAECSGTLVVNYRFVNPRTGEVLRNEKIEKTHSSKGEASSRSGALGKLPQKTQVLSSLVSQANSSLVASFAQVEVRANYALAIMKDDEFFTNSLKLVKKGDWESAAEIWDRFEEENRKEAFYNKMLYKRYIVGDLNDAISYASLAYQKTGDASFPKWLAKFEKEKQLEDAFKNPASVGTTAPVVPAEMPAEIPSDDASSVESTN